MVRSGTARTGAPDGTRDQQSLGDLVSLALKDVSQLVRYEIGLAKSELRIDVRRAAIGGGLFAFILIVGYPLLIMLLFAYAYGLYAVGAPGGLWGAFLWVALTCAVFACIAGFIGLRFFKKITGMRLTRKTVSDDIGMLKRAASSPDSADGTAAVDGTGSRALGGSTKKEQAKAAKDRSSGGDAPASLAARSLAR